MVLGPQDGPCTLALAADTARFLAQNPCRKAGEGVDSDHWRTTVALLLVPLILAVGVVVYLVVSY